MAREIYEKENTSSRYKSVPYLNTSQLEYTAKQMFVYGLIATTALTLGATYIYLLAQKIRT